MFARLQRKYFKYRARLAQDDMYMTMGMFNVKEEQLYGNYSYNISKAKRDYYLTRAKWAI